MCWQDVQISNQQYVQSVTTGAAPSGDTVFIADSRRRRIIVTADLSPGIGEMRATVTIYRGTDGTNNSAILVSQLLTMPFVFDVALFGTVVNGPLVVTVTDILGDSRYAITEVILIDPQGYGTPNQSTPRG